MVSLGVILIVLINNSEGVVHIENELCVECVIICVCIWCGVAKDRRCGWGQSNATLRVLWNECSDQKYEVYGANRNDELWYVCVRLRCRQEITMCIRLKKFCVEDLMERVFGSKMRRVWCKQEWRIMVRVRVVAL